MKRAKIHSEFKTYDGRIKQRYVIDEGHYMVMGQTALPNTEGATGVIVPNYKKAELLAAAEELGLKSVWVSVERNGELAIAKLDDGFYSIWRHGECVFAENGDPVGVMDSAGQ